MSVLNPEYEFKWKDLWFILPQMCGMNPVLFWFLQLVLGIIFIWVIYFSGWFF